ncbi:hypothetical protein BH23ACT1_BH23ACT1_14440 [soil metagenome]
MQRIAGVLVCALALVLALPATATASNDPFFSQQWGLEAIGAEAAWAKGRGAGTVIAVVDTGVDLDHEDLIGKVIPGASFPSGSPQDDNGHGTHVAGIAAASTSNGIGIAGVAPDARILPVKVLNANGSGNVAQVAQGIRFAADNGADVINLSFGEVSTDVDLSSAFTDAIRYAWAKGAIPVVAAGNDFVRTSSFTDEPVIVVTSIGSDGTRPGYASGVGNARWGLAAPGGDGNPGSERSSDSCDPDTAIVSTYTEPSYVCLVGTSMAVPHVAGAAAVLRSIGLSPEQTVAQLLATADDIGASGTDSTFGAGRLNLARAAQAAAPPTTVPPTTEAPTTTTEAPTTIAAAPTPAPTTTTPTPATTVEQPPTTTIPSPTVSLPPVVATPIEPPEGQAVALLPDDGDGSVRYVLAAPAGLLALGVGFASWRMRRQLPWG